MLLFGTGGERDEAAFRRIESDPRRGSPWTPSKTYEKALFIKADVT